MNETHFKQLLHDMAVSESTQIEQKFESASSLTEHVRAVEEVLSEMPYIMARMIDKLSEVKDS